MAAEKGNQYAIGNEGGRPTKYDPKYCQEIIDYFDVEPFEDREIPHYKGDEVSWVDFKRVANRIPKFHEFAKSIGVHRDTLHEWCKEYNEFSDAYNYAKELQKWFLIENGLNSTYNPSSYIFTAKNITDMRDYSDLNVTGKGISIETTSEEQSQKLKDLEEKLNKVKNEAD